MGVPVCKSEKSDLGKMPMLTAPSMPALPFAKSHFIPGPAVDGVSRSERSAKISEPLGNLDLPGHFPFAIGSAVAGEGGGGPGGRDDDQRGDQPPAQAT
eukprot:2419287-Pyramimonas_sp.AAC.1